MGKAVYPKVCGARKKRGGLCQAPAGRGTPHPGYGSCSLHGGNTKTGEIAGARYEARAELARYGGAIDIEAHEALLLCIRIAAGEVQSAAEFVERLEANELLEHPEEVLQRPLHGERGAEEPRTVVQETTFPLSHPDDPACRLLRSYRSVAAGDRREWAARQPAAVVRHV